MLPVNEFLQSKCTVLDIYEVENLAVCARAFACMCVRQHETSSSELVLRVSMRLSYSKWEGVWWCFSINNTLKSAFDDSCLLAYEAIILISLA